MLRDRYAPMNRFDLGPKLGREMDPELAQLDRLLADAVLFQRVRADLVKRCPKTGTPGRSSPPVEVILRMLVSKRRYGWSDEQTERCVADRLVLRQFCRVDLEAVPDDTTGVPLGPRWANLIGPKTGEQLNDRVGALARARKVTRGRKRRVDSTVVETNIPYPTDSRLLGDGVRVLSRLVRRAKHGIGECAQLGTEAFRSRTRSVRRFAQQLHRVARRKGEAAAEERQGADRKLIGIAAASRAHAEQVRDVLPAQAATTSRRLGERLNPVLPLVEQAIIPATRRVLDGAVVPSREKLLSRFEPPTQVIKRHKAGKAGEFGRKRGAPWAGRKWMGASSVAIASSRKPARMMRIWPKALKHTNGASGNRRGW